MVWEGEELTYFTCTVTAESVQNDTDGNEPSNVQCYAFIYLMKRILQKLELKFKGQGNFDHSCQRSISEHLPGEFFQFGTNVHLGST